ncbi:hypothetical protein CEXT_512581 [Caerostris extrusa]|uniref:Uncharacterized protein n=1 Tax=Caerostris extrusa TaxID=172846 RepID=A0AAV4XJU5_CAEEX|nr:hypothetical protein CEXT_512581 [Caerostris extrusa]
MRQPCMIKVKGRCSSKRENGRGGTSELERQADPPQGDFLRPLFRLFLVTGRFSEEVFASISKEMDKALKIKNLYPVHCPLFNQEASNTLHTKIESSPPLRRDILI